MDVSLPPELEQFVKDTVNAGQYEDASAVVAHALHSLRFRETVFPEGGELERLIAEGQAEADRREGMPGDEVFREILARNAERTRNQ